MSERKIEAVSIEDIAQAMGLMDEKGRTPVDCWEEDGKVYFGWASEPEPKRPELPEDVIAIANSAYPDGVIGSYWELLEEYGSRAKIPHTELLGVGDTLAEFIVLEIRDTWDPSAKTSDALDVLSGVFDRASRELMGLAERFETEADRWEDLDAEG